MDLELLKDCWCGSLGNLLDIILYGAKCWGKLRFMILLDCSFELSECFTFLGRRRNLKTWTAGTRNFHILNQPFRWVQPAGAFDVKEFYFLGECSSGGWVHISIFHSFFLDVRGLGAEGWGSAFMTGFWLGWRHLDGFLRNIDFLSSW